MWGAGVKLIRHLQFGVNYNFALGHTATLYADPNIILDGKPLTQDVKIKNNTWQVSWHTCLDNLINKR